MAMGEELSGALMERVAIETWLAARDDAGADAGHWQASGSAAAAVVPDGRATSPLAEARRSGQRWRVTLRASPATVAPVGLLSRLIWQGRVLAVLATESDPRRPDRQLLICEERQP
jgi:head-tail adaptor